MKKNIVASPGPSPPLHIFKTTTKDPNKPLVADTAASKHFGIVNCQYLDDVQLTRNPIPVEAANGEIMTSTHTGYLPIPELSKEARQVDILPGLTTSLCSMGQLADAGCIIVFDKDICLITLNGKIIMSGIRKNKLWHLELPQHMYRSDNHIEPEAHYVARHQLANHGCERAHLVFATAVKASATPRELVEFACAALGNPSMSTL